MNTPMFDQPQDEVTTLFDESGYLIVIISRHFGKVQSHDYTTGMLRVNTNAIKSITKLHTHSYCQDCDVYSIRLGTFRYDGNYSVRDDVRAYTERFIANLAPEPTQGTLF